MIELYSWLNSIFDSLDRADVRWCLLRDETDLALPDGDVDLLVAPDDIPAARLILTGHDLAQIPLRGGRAPAFWLGYDPSQNYWLRLDVASELSYGRPDFPFVAGTAHGLLARRQRGSGFWTLHPDDAFWALLLHCLLDEHSVPAEYQGRLQDWARAGCTGGPLADFLAEVEPEPGFLERLVAAAAAGRWESLADMGCQLAWSWHRRQPVATRARQLAGRTRQVLDLPRVLRHRFGLGVALLGPDGAGKSTLAQGIGDTFHFPVRVVYMGLWQDRGGWWNRVPGLSLATRPATIWYRYLLSLYHRAHGRLVIFDRYTYDALLPPRPPLVWLKRVYFWLVAHSCPGPDLVLVLDAPPHVVRGRKDESDLPRLELERRSFLDLPVAHLQVVDASRDRDVVLADVVSRIWQRYRSRPHGAAVT